MSFLTKITLYFLLCGIVNYVALLEQTAIGLVFFWPGNALGAFLAVYWRSRHRRGRHTRQIFFLVVFFVSHYIGSVLTPQPMTYLQQLYLVLVDTAYVGLYVASLYIVLSFRRSFSSYRGTALLVLPVVITVLLQGAAVGLILNNVIVLGETEFVFIDWISEQLATGMIVTMIMAGTMTKAWGVKRQRVSLRNASIIAGLALFQVAMLFSNWLTITTITILPSVFAILTLGFAWSLLVTGCFMLFSTAAQMYFYVSVHNYRETATFYPEIFSHRIDLSMIAILAVFMGELVTQRKRLVESLRRQAETDRLTMLYNRNFVLSALRQISSPRRVGLLVLDIDDFKRINDVFGHHIGDEVIIAVANTIKRTIRTTDIAARWGGEEFLIVMPGVASESLPAICNRIIEDVRNQTIRIGEDSINFTVSVGGILVPNFTESDFKNAFSSADGLLYQAKSTGKNRAVLHMN